MKCNGTQDLLMSDADDVSEIENAGDALLKLLVEIT